MAKVTSKLQVTIPKAIAEQYGYTVSSEEVAAVRDENDFIKLGSTAIERSAKD